MTGQAAFGTVRRQHWRELTIVLAVAVPIAVVLANLWLVWVGFTKSDDVFYAGAAMGWVRIFHSWV